MGKWELSFIVGGLLKTRHCFGIVFWHLNSVTISPCDFTQNIYKVEWKTVNTKIFLQLLIAALFTTVKMEITKTHRVVNKI